MRCSTTCRSWTCGRRWMSGHRESLEFRVLSFESDIEGRRRVRPNSEGGQSFTEIALAMAIMAAVLALAIFVVVPKVRPGESTSQQDAYVRAVATQQARAY